MAVEFKETITKVQEKVSGAGEKVATMLDKAEAGDIPGTKGHHPVSAVIGTAITGGMENAGTKGYLAVRHPNSSTSRHPRRSHDRYERDKSAYDHQRP